MILDCCFSGRAIPLLGSETSGVRGNIDNIKGTCTLAATRGSESALAPEGEKYTAFSGKLIQALQEGIENQKREITLVDLYNYIRPKLMSRGMPEPQKAFVNGADQIVIALNRKFELLRVPLASPEEISEHCMRVVPKIIQGNVVFFLGWDINLYGRQAELAWRPDQFKFLPTMSELTTYLSNKYNYPLINEKQNFSLVSQFIVNQYGFPELFATLNGIMGKHYPPTRLHHFLAKLPDIIASCGSRHYPLIITTNYDNALERAFVKNKQPFDLVYYVAKGKNRGKFVHCPPDGKARLTKERNYTEERNYENDVSFKHYPVILKICGTLTPIHSTLDSYSGLNDNGFVIGQDFAHFDYIDVMELPISLIHKLYNNDVLFLGCRSQDWNLLNLLRHLWGDQRNKDILLKTELLSWIEPSPLVLDQQSLEASSSIEVFSAPLEKYLTELFKQLERIV